MNTEDRTNEITHADHTSLEYWKDDLASSISWKYKSCVYHRNIFKYISIPDNGKVVQLGTGYGLGLEILANQFPGRTSGYDIFNYGEHPLVNICDIRQMPDFDVAYVHCNVGNFTNTPLLRKIGLEWTLKNLVPGGYCLTAGGNEYVNSYFNFNFNDLVKSYNCEITAMPCDDEFESMLHANLYDYRHECLIKKNG